MRRTSSTGPTTKEFERLRREALLHGLTLVAAPVRHVGTERAYEILTRMRADLEGDISVATSTPAVRILTEHGKVTGVATSDGSEYLADAVVVAPGRQGAGWLVDECRRLGLGICINAVDIGVRVEVPAVVMEPLTDVLYESKLIYYSPTFDDQVRTFCMNPYGEVTLENYGDVLTVNGHSYADQRTENTNFALLVSTQFTEPFDDPSRTASPSPDWRTCSVTTSSSSASATCSRASARRRTACGVATVQPTLRGATPGDLSFVLPYRYLRDILEMLEAMDALVPGVKARDTLLYGAEVKFYSARPRLDAGLQTPIRASTLWETAPA